MNKKPHVILHHTKKEETQDSSLNPESRMFSSDGVFVGTSEDVHELKEELESLKDDWSMCDTARDELTLENRKLKLLLKESFESFPTKRLADRIYSIDGIERPEPEPIPMKPGEETSF